MCVCMYVCVCVTSIHGALLSDVLTVFMRACVLRVDFETFSMESTTIKVHIIYV